MLDEPEMELKVHALKQLHQGLVDLYYMEIANSIPKIEALYETEEFKERELAAAVASKVFYHLEELDEALKYALGSGDYFDINAKSEFVETLISKCIDEYIKRRAEAFEAKTEPVLDQRLVLVVDRMFERCFEEGKYKHALGVAIESRRTDMVRRAILDSGDAPELIAHCYEVSQSVIQNREFRKQVLLVLVDLLKTLQVPDYISMCQCWLFLDDHQSVANTLNSLISFTDSDQHLMAYQVAFDLIENQNQSFLNRVITSLSESAADPAAAVTTGGDKMDTTSDKKEEEDTYNVRAKRLRHILSGKLSIELYLHFLYGQNKTDLNILKSIKDKLEPRNMVLHNATVMAHALMHAGTTSDDFLRDNLDWLRRSTNWAKFTATSSIGVIHRGHHDKSSKLLEPYLPQGGGSSPFEEGGALYALGLIHANHGEDKIPFLREHLKGTQNETVQHGAALGLGLAAMGSGNREIFEELKALVAMDSAVAGEAAGYAMGLVMLGHNDGAVMEEMLSYAHETQHEKIIRGLSMGMALMVFGREEEADVLIDDIIRDKDPLLRYGAMYAVGMAYAATGSKTAIRRLLHSAVSDVNDDVRRAAVTAIGFVMANVPHQVPRIVSLLADSYNAHVRYGASLAVGIACAGTGSKEAIELLEPLMLDRTDFVRQGAMIAMAMVLIQFNEVNQPKVKEFRKNILELVASKGDTMTKLGAIIAAGILDAGGRNVTIALLSQAGHRKIEAFVGMAMFTNFWYWYPLTHFLSLSLTPTAVIGLNKDLKMPKNFSFISNAKPSTYAYPAPMEIKKEEKKQKVKATLSVTAKAKARAKKKEDGKKGTSMEVDEPATPSSAAMQTETDATSPKAATTAESADGKPADAAESVDGKKAVDKKEPEPESETLNNPCRVTWAQQAVLSYSSEQRYKPVKKRLGGIVLLKDTQPGSSEDIVQQAVIKVGVPGVSSDEPEPPEPFDFTR